MRLRRKVSLAILATFIMIFLITLLGAQRILKNNYLQLENQLVEDNIDRVNDSLNQMVDTLETMVKSAAIWDDMYQLPFSEDSNKKMQFFKSVFSAASIASNDEDISFLYNTQGKLINAIALNKTRTDAVPVPNDIWPYLTPESLLIKNPVNNHPVKGLLSLQSGILLIASYPILTSNGNGPPHGALIQGKYLSEHLLKILQEKTKLTIQLLPLSKKIPKETVLVKSPDTVFAYFTLKDINQQPIAVLKIAIPRTEFLSGVYTLQYFNLAFLSFGILFMLLLAYLINALVVKRLEKINKQIITIGDTQQFSLSLDEKGSDEIGSVAKETNKTLNTIEEYNNMRQELLNKVSDELDIVNQFSEKLKQAEYFLTDIINSMPSVLLITDNNLNINDCNARTEELLQLSSNHIKGKNLFDLFPFLKNYDAQFKEAIQKQVFITLDKLAHIIHNQHYYNIIIYPLGKELKKENAFVIRIDDVTERIKLEETVLQNDKLASIGILTAGIAHEINNPINFVTATITPLKNNLEDILNSLKKLSAINSNQDPAAIKKEIDDLKADMDLEYTVKEIYQLLDGIKEGANRTATIIKDLRIFSRVDEDAMKKINLHEGMNSTLTLLQHHFKNRINIIKEFGDIPLIDCYPGKLNQVFMNILSNAMDAIHEKGDIIIQTYQEKDQVIIRIKDTGTGIRKEHLTKIFDPFFTTKDIGKGTGLGLSICHSIIRDHGGSIEVQSELNSGTEFIITLPITHPEVS